jgi:uncharacterized membrane protein
MTTSICSSNNQAQRRYINRMWIAAGLSLVFSAVAKVAFLLAHLHGVFACLVAVLAALPILGALFATGAYLSEEKDEFQRDVLIQSLLGGIGLTLAATTVWGYLEDFVRAPGLDLIWVYPLFWLFALISYPVVKARYR